MKRSIHCSILYKFMALMLFTGILYTQETLAKTIHPPIDEPILEIKFRCSEAKECSAQPEENVVFLEKGDIYLDENDQEITVNENGFLITDEVKTTSEKQDDLLLEQPVDEKTQSKKYLNVKFITLKNTKPSPDDNFYSCDKGRNYVLDDNSISIEEITEDKEVFDSLISGLNCPCFWAPKNVLSSLNPTIPDADLTQLVPPSDLILIPPTTVVTKKPIDPVFPNPCLFCNPWNPGPGTWPKPPVEPPPSPVSIGGEKMGLFGFLNPFILWKLYSESE